MVLGGSFAGLVTARVLTGHAERVTLVERDRLPVDAGHRSGLPQASHTHVLQPRGLRVLEGLYPGIAASLRDCGAVVLDDLSQMSFCAFGRPFSRGPMPRPLTLLASRDLLEHEVRSRSRLLARLEVVEGAQVGGLVRDPSTGRVTGIRLHEVGSQGPASVLDADLVVDATGRASRLDAWLRDLGVPVPPHRELRVDVRYVSQPLLLPEGAVPEHLVVVGPRPDRRLGFYLPRYEGGLRLCTVMGYGASGPPPDRDALLAITEQLAPAHVVDAIRCSEQVGPPTTYRFPASRRRDLGRALPERLLVVGDSLCSFNPIYGQGMTVAACQAVAMGAALTEGLHDLSRRYLRRADQIADQAWEVSVPADRGFLGLPQTVRQRVEQRYLGRLLDRARHDPETALAVLDVLTMNRPKSSLMRPTALRRALTPGTSAA